MVIGAPDSLGARLGGRRFGGRRFGLPHDIARPVLNGRMQPDDAPMPSAVADRPRDPRGYPVPAITPWHNGVPMFAATSTSRSLICAVERRCSICGTPLGTGPVWRVVAAEEAQAIAEAQTTGRTYVNRAGTAEAPGHLGCMLYAAMICPYLARPNARRGVEAHIGDFAAHRGAARGELDGLGGAVVGFETYEFEVVEQVSFRFSGLVSFRPHRLGIEHLPELQKLLASDDPPAGTVTYVDHPPYLLADEAAAEQRAADYR